MHTVYGMALSGNCYKVRLILEQLGIPYRWEEVDSTRGQTRTPEFLAINPAGQVPALELPDGERLYESNAILCYLAEGTPLLAGDRLGRARILQWLFFEQYSHEPYIAVARSILRFRPADDPRRADLPRLREGGRQALALMEGRLAEGDFLVGETFSIADIALFAYTHVADEAGFDLAPYPGIRAWLDRVRDRPGFVPMAPLT